MTELHVPEKGPYMNDDGDWWVPVECASFREARAAIVGRLLAFHFQENRLW